MDTTVFGATVFADFASEGQTLVQLYLQISHQHFWLFLSCYFGGTFQFVGPQEDRRLHILCASITGWQDSLNLVEAADRIDQYLDVDTRQLVGFQLYSPNSTQFTRLSSQQTPGPYFSEDRNSIESIPPGQPDPIFVPITAEETPSLFPPTQVQASLPCPLEVDKLDSLPETIPADSILVNATLPWPRVLGSVFVGSPTSPAPYSPTSDTYRQSIEGDVPSRKRDSSMAAVRSTMFDKKKKGENTSSSNKREEQPVENGGGIDSDSGSDISDGEVKDMIKALYKKQSKDAKAVKKMVTGITTELAAVQTGLTSVTENVKKLDEELDDRIDARIKTAMVRQDGGQSAIFTAVSSATAAPASDLGFVPQYFKFGGLWKFEDTRESGPTHDQVLAYAKTIKELCSNEVQQLLSFDIGHIITKYDRVNQFWWHLKQPSDGTAIPLSVIRGAETEIRKAVASKSYSELSRTFVNLQEAPGRESRRNDLVSCKNFIVTQLKDAGWTAVQAKIATNRVVIITMTKQENSTDPLSHGTARTENNVSAGGIDKAGIAFVSRHFTQIFGLIQQDLEGELACILR